MDVKTWLTGEEADPAIRYQAARDLYETSESVSASLRKRIEREGWGARYLDLRKPGQHWGDSFYAHKWTNSHYTLTELRYMGLPQDNPDAREVVDRIAQEFNHPTKEHPGGVITSDLCINGMFMNFATYFGADQEGLIPIVDFILALPMPDGGFNCRINRSRPLPVHSSLHTTLCVLEGIQSYAENGYTYRLDELTAAADTGRDFILRHRLYRSDHTGAVIHPSFLMLSCPWRWYYDILRALCYFEEARILYDSRMEDALVVLRGKQRADGTWPVQNRHPGAVFFQMEKTGGSSRWNTLRALRVLRAYDPGGWLNNGQETESDS